eukprot:NODE_16916_length_304_cov_1.117647_g15749_i0.p2 GENE.NODE_16916_length_304_cov_1.117647_g15749_i0~~NODE_16916_length_304_cov_1.117647_g15749_i0.p2  ORF type:complete len:53 (+),score=0.15 NODE_16916_length_304_cov_1.117647_g15749_i0:2-160(+)
MSRRAPTTQRPLPDIPTNKGAEVACKLTQRFFYPSRVSDSEDWSEIRGYGSA